MSRKILAFLIAVTGLVTLHVNRPLYSEDKDGLSKADVRKQCRILLKQGQQYMAEGYYDSAKTVIDSVFLCDPVNADAFYNKAIVNLKTGDTSDAIESLSDGVEKAPLSARLKISLARLQLITGQYDEASRLVELVLAIRPDEGEALYLKGLVLLAEADTSAAIAALQKALENAME